ncbi:hypothetical protein HPB50_024135 [Hyalomma asiaticum]|uniref:Uncharacterized protein n=1 Tax=Hyalomma asiaticum TaxID=266040 RepID=A0ACB7TLF6_HYAAI|nr:hypothetical protein HPB50_024135 [Hyalomma asiaticum]
MPSGFSRMLRSKVGHASIDSRGLPYSGTFSGAHISTPPWPPRADEPRSCPHVDRGQFRLVSVPSRGTRKYIASGALFSGEGPRCPSLGGAGARLRNGNYVPFSRPQQDQEPRALCAIKPPLFDDGALSGAETLNSGSQPLLAFVRPPVGLAGGSRVFLLPNAG